MNLIKIILKKKFIKIKIKLKKKKKKIKKIK